MKSVVIVGAGIVGLYCAVRLAKAGARVTLLEAEPEARTVHGPAASVAAAGMLAPFDTESSAHESVALASFDLWRTARAGATWADDVRFDGAVYLSASADAAAALQARIVSVGRSARPLSPGEAGRRLGVKGDFAQALFVADEGVADPLRVMSGLAYDAHTYGVVVRYNQDVMRVTPHAAFTHEGETHEADFVVLAPGVWASEALMQAAPVLRKIRPAKGHLVGVTTKRPLGASLHTPGFYLARRRDSTVLGATLEFDRADRRVDHAQAEGLLAAAAETLPNALAAHGEPWAGVRPMSPDGWPMIGPTGAGILLAAGHSRHGWLLAPITAEIVTAYVLGNAIPPAWAALAPKRFET